jgi:uncharacterized membrane protein
MLTLLLTALIFILLDTFWFSWSLDPIYRPTFLAIQGSPLELRLAGGIVAWFLLAAGIRYFAVGSVSTVGEENSQSKLQLFTRGAFLGAVIYGVYNGTNYATFSNYPVSTAIADTLWGTFAVGTVSVISGTYL